MHLLGREPPTNDPTWNLSVQLQYFILCMLINKTTLNDQAYKQTNSKLDRL